MKKLIKLDLSTTTPPLKISVHLKYSIAPIHGFLEIYRTPADPNPITVKGNGLTDIELIEAQTLYVHISPEIQNYEISVLGFKYK